MERRFGTHPDIPDFRDRAYLPVAKSARLPGSVDLRPECPPVYEQKSLNSCSANAIAAAIWFDELRGGRAHAFDPSRLFIYYNERRSEHRIAKNAPVSLRDGYKSVVRFGVCSEDRWPYRTSRFADRPPQSCYAEGGRHRVNGYFRISRNLRHLKACLAEGFPFSLAISVHESFKSARVSHSGEVSLPRRGEKLLGGHAVLAVGYHDASARLIVRNSWGSSWGHHGYFFLPYDYVLHESLAWDFWTIRSVSE